ncbi:DHHC-type Zn-finger protein [Handroanthus impetiginosus]|uniref:S-acyltransferase n=1 Tax=Handroanthus impetiginosus TaxID=429701 RepID=A0A2G9FWZ8_9LAMI|nr:DHHC-type Zn-finger protein [Handroanthus impetiginosus]
MYSPPLPRHHLSHSNRRQLVDSDGPPLRLYQVWKGRNKFLFGGRFIFGPDVRSLFLTLSLILAPLSLFWAFVARGLINAFSHGGGLIIVIFSVILTAHIIVLLFLTSGRDPGIIPRNPHPPDPDDCDTSSLSTDWLGSQSSAPVIPPTKNVMVNGIVVKVKYCQTCMLYRPPRCSHCSICNNCVERFDHHCPWVGQCIGKRNYRYFFMFVSSLTVLCLYVLTCCLINVKRIMDEDNCNIWKAIQISPVSGILIMYTFVVCWFVGGLTAFHLYLISTNQTTYENFRYQYDRKMNPYNLGCARNFKEVFCSTIAHPRSNYRARVTSSYVEKKISPEMPNRSLDMEMERRQAVDADEFEDIRNQVGSFGGLERCGTQPRCDDWDQTSNSETTPDKYMLSFEFGTEPCIKDRETVSIDP